MRSIYCSGSAFATQIAGTEGYFICTSPSTCAFANLGVGWQAIQFRTLGRFKWRKCCDYGCLWQTYFCEIPQFWRQNGGKDSFWNSESLPFSSFICSFSDAAGAQTVIGRYEAATNITFLGLISCVIFRCLLILLLQCNIHIVN